MADSAGMVDHEAAAILSRFGKRVRCLRTGKELSQEELAHLSDLDRTYIGGIERGERNVSLLNIIKIANALEVSPHVLFLDN